MIRKGVLWVIVKIGIVNFMTKLLLIIVLRVMIQMIVWIRKMIGWLMVWKFKCAIQRMPALSGLRKAIYVLAFRDQLQGIG